MAGILGGVRGFVGTIERATGSAMRGDTIFALASGAGRAGIAVMRISGPLAGEVWDRLSAAPRAAPLRFTRLRLREPGSGEVLDEGLGVWFPGPRSFTGEDVVEFHLHGGRAVVSGVAEAVAAAPGCRMAEPGEFSRRAFENGKMDLTAAEGLADLVAAETAAQRRQGLRQMRGELAAVYEGWRERLMRSLAQVEAAIDFPEDDLAEDLISSVIPQIRGVGDEIRLHLDDGHRGERVRDGILVALVGAPNVGKSSLLNRLVRREAAIVSASAGTTRDVIEVELDLGGYPVVLADLAGVREVRDEVEAEGVRRARVRAGESDLKLVVFDGTDWPKLDSGSLGYVDEEAVVVVNKVDVADVPTAPRIGQKHGFRISALTGEGIEGLVEVLTAKVSRVFEAGAGPALTRERYRGCLRECLAGLRRCREAELPELLAELLAEELRLATRALGRITGRVDVEDLLDVIFREFCIGK